jgi:Flp pilus assembly protein TadD
MLSSNSHKPYRILGLAAAVSLALGQAAQAGDAAHNFVLTAYSNGTGGTELISGNYGAAAETLHRPPTISALDASTTSNNRCVALAMTKQWDSARIACDQAVRDAQQERAMLPSYQYWARKFKNDYLAVALSNRAVLHWMSSDAAAAATDLKRAETLSPNADFVTRNRAALEYSHTSGALAQVAVTPSSP